MLKYIWSFLILSGFVVAILQGRMEEMTKGFMDGSASAITIVIGLAGTMCFWSGIMEIAKDGGILEAMSKLAAPFMRVVFPELPKNHPATAAVVMNMSANILGLGNAATPFGLKAMEEMNQLNSKRSICSNSMIMFLVLNTSMLQLVPATIIALRASLGSKNPSDVTIAIWLTSIIATIMGVFIVRIFGIFERSTLE